MSTLVLNGTGQKFRIKTAPSQRPVKVTMLGQGKPKTVTIRQAA